MHDTNAMGFDEVSFVPRSYVTRFPHLLCFLLSTPVGARARFRRAFALTVALALVSLYSGRWRRGPLSGRLGERGHIHFIVLGTTEFDFQSYRLQWRGWHQGRR